MSADLFYAQQSWFLIVVDYYSKFPFVRKLNNLSTGAVVKEINTIFAENRIPETLQCANNPQFTSVEFQQAASQYGFNIIMSFPHYPRGHGSAEHQVQTVKRFILECGETTPRNSLRYTRAKPYTYKIPRGRHGVPLRSQIKEIHTAPILWKLRPVSTCEGIGSTLDRTTHPTIQQKNS